MLKRILQNIVLAIGWALFGVSLWLYYIKEMVGLFWVFLIAALIVSLGGTILIWFIFKDKTDKK